MDHAALEQTAHSSCFTGWNVFWGGFDSFSRGGVESSLVHVQIVVWKYHSYTVEGFGVKVKYKASVSPLVGVCMITLWCLMMCFDFKSWPFAALIPIQNYLLSPTPPTWNETSLMPQVEYQPSHWSVTVSSNSIHHKQTNWDSTVTSSFPPTSSFFNASDIKLSCANRKWHGQPGSSVFTNPQFEQLVKSWTFSNANGNSV